MYHLDCEPNIYKVDLSKKAKYTYYAIMQT
jgi:hypothetical protein